MPGVYLHAIGGAATLIAQTVKRVPGVYKYDFGVPEAIWVVPDDRREIDARVQAFLERSEGYSLEAAR